MDLRGYEAVLTLAGKILLYNVAERKAVTVYTLDYVEFEEGEEVRAYNVKLDSQRMMHVRSIVKSRLKANKVIEKNEGEAALWRLLLLLPERRQIDVVEGYREYCHKLPYEGKLGSPSCVDMTSLKHIEGFEETTGIKADSIISATRTSDTRVRIYYIGRNGNICYKSVNLDKNNYNVLISMIGMYYISRIDRSSIERNIDNLINNSLNYVRCSDVIGKNIEDVESLLLERYYISEKYIYSVFEVEYMTLEDGTE